MWVCGGGGGGGGGVRNIRNIKSEKELLIVEFPIPSICLTKMDILDDFDEIKIGVAYKLKGKVLDSMPGGCVQPLPLPH